MLQSTPRHVDAGGDCARLIESFRRSLAEQGYGPGQPVPREALTVAVFRSSRELTQRALGGG